MKVYKQIGITNLMRSFSKGSRSGKRSSGRFGDDRSKRFGREDSPRSERSEPDRFDRRESGRFDKREPDRFEKRYPERSERRMHTVTCAKCGEQCEVPFRPTGGKPVYCSNCFRKSDGYEPKSADPSKSELDQINKKLDKIMKALKIE